MNQEKQMITDYGMKKVYLQDRNTEYVQLYPKPKLILTVGKPLTHVR